MFKVRIKSGSIKIVAELPQEVQMNLEQDWENPFKMESGAGVRAAFDALSKRLGWGSQTLSWDHNQLYTWMGGSPLQFNLDLEFVAKSNIETDIIAPLKNLFKISSPQSSGSLLRNLQPPSLSSISIGNIIYIPNVIINVVAPSFGRPLVSDGNNFRIPSRVSATISIQTKRIMTKERVDEYFFTSNRVF